MGRGHYLYSNIEGSEVTNCHFVSPACGWHSGQRTLPWRHTGLSNIPGRQSACLTFQAGSLQAMMPSLPGELHGHSFFPWPSRGRSGRPSWKLGGKNSFLGSSRARATWPMRESNNSHPQVARLSAGWVHSGLGQDCSEAHLTDRKARAVWNDTNGLKTGTPSCFLYLIPCCLQMKAGGHGDHRIDTAWS